MITPSPFPCPLPGVAAGMRPNLPVPRPLDPCTRLRSFVADLFIAGQIAEFEEHVHDSLELIDAARPVQDASDLRRELHELHRHAVDGEIRAVSGDPNRAVCMFELEVERSPQPCHLAIHLVAEYRGHAIARLHRVVDTFIPHGGAFSSQPFVEPLGPREAARCCEHWALSPPRAGIAERVLQGATDREIANELDVPLGLVRSTVMVLFRRANIRNRLELLHRTGRLSVA